MIVFHSPVHDAVKNLSIEKWLLKREDLKEEEVLLFYSNSPAVIIGRFQNPWLECDLPGMARSGVPLVRRESGGGAVYHDRGNLNFSFMAPEEKMVKEERTAIVTKALRSLNIKADQGERNDIYIEGRKISGSAGRYTSKRAMHHGTLLISADLEALDTYLIAGKYKSGDLKSRGTESIRSKVANIAEFNGDLDSDRISRAIIDETSRYLNSPAELLKMEKDELDKVKEIGETAAHLTSWDWLFGKTPGFTLFCPLDLEGRQYSCLLEIRKGLIGKMLYDSDPQIEKGLNEAYQSLLNSPVNPLMDTLTQTTSREEHLSGPPEALP